MAIDTTKVLIGTAALWTAPKGTAMVDDTVDPGADWDSPWAFVGGTDEGVTLAVGTDTGEIRIEEQSTPVIVVVNAKTVQIRVTLSEDTPENMKLAYGGGTLSTIAAAAGVAGKKKLVLSNSLDQLAAGFEGVNAAGLPRRVYVPSVLSVADVETAYRRSAAARTYNVVLNAVCDPSDIEIDDWTSLPT